ncbi:hypothetical protein [Companilactobacillus kimchiensis]|uniref:Uncharacterized protein n=1 Tax=Companilactobacillus kimchiensis TaxID=993692 RepID=A0A0R2LG47_9LACO|nr:hypothetical protein [Companilactobacillus kimchiensis]KRO00793.1 hypothetical protein IV57_GL000113 [Companilactobacillus kimchiensis]
MFGISFLMEIALLTLGVVLVVLSGVSLKRARKVNTRIGKNKSKQFNAEISRIIIKERPRTPRLILLFILLWGVMIGILCIGLYAGYIYQDDGLFRLVSAICLIITLVEFGLSQSYLKLKFKTCTKYFNENNESKYTDTSTELFNHLKQLSLSSVFFYLGLIFTLVSTVI